MRIQKLSEISLNRLHSMNGGVFISQLLGGLVKVTAGVPTMGGQSVAIQGNDDFELLYQEFVWDQQQKGAVGE